MATAKPGAADGQILRKSLRRYIQNRIKLYPGTEITPATANLFAAAKQSLVFRGDDGTGWSSAWKVNLWARLLDDEHAHLILQPQLRPVLNNTISSSRLHYSKAENGAVAN